MNKKELYIKTREMIELMAKNRFLLPDSHSDTVFLQSGKSYRTYADSTGRTYIIFYLLKEDGSQLYDIKYSRGEIRIEGVSIFEKSPTPQEVHDAILEIYTEKHSFEQMNEGKKKLIKEIHDKYMSKKQIESDISTLEASLKDFDNVQES